MSVYNGAEYLHDAIKSILEQTYTDFEFIIFDDASTDKSLEILNEFAATDSRIKIIRKEKNIGFKGFVENLNMGIKMAKGKYIARMDADDISMPERFLKQVDFLEQNPNIFMIGSFLNIMNEKGSITGELLSETNPEILKKQMLKKVALFHPVIMFRNNENTFYRNKFVGCEDYDLYLRLISEEKKLSNIPEKLLTYRILENSISRSDKKFIRWLFVEKAKEFYFEREKTGKDSYDDFNETDLLNILNKTYQNNEIDLDFACKVALKFSDKISLIEILSKIENQFPKNKRFVKYKLLSKISGKPFLWASKLYTKLFS